MGRMQHSRAWKSQKGYGASSCKAPEIIRIVFHPQPPSLLIFSLNLSQKEKSLVSKENLSLPTKEVRVLEIAVGEVLIRPGSPCRRMSSWSLFPERERVPAKVGHKLDPHNLFRWAKSRDSYRRIVARVIAAIRIASVRWRSYLPPKHRN